MLNCCHGTHVREAKWICWANIKTRAWTLGKLSLLKARLEINRRTPGHNFVDLFNVLPIKITNHLENPYVIRERSLLKLLESHINSDDNDP